MIRICRGVACPGEQVCDDGRAIVQMMLNTGCQNCLTTSLMLHEIDPRPRERCMSATKLQDQGVVA